MENGQQVKSQELTTPVQAPWDDLKRLALDYWAEALPKAFAYLQSKGIAEQVAANAAERTANLYGQLIEDGLSHDQAHELAIREFILIPGEDEQEEPEEESVPPIFTGLDESLSFDFEQQYDDEEESDESPSKDISNELLEACRNGDYALGLDLGHGKDLILNCPSESWEMLWGERPPAFWRPLIVFLLASPLLSLAGIVMGFILWHWYWALLMVPCTLFVTLYPPLRGFPHPAPWRYLLTAIAFWGVALTDDRLYIPIALIATAMSFTHLMYFLTGVFLRGYALRHPQAFGEWVETGFLLIQK